MRNYLFLVLICFFVSGCAAVHVTTTTFYVPDYKPGGKIVVVVKGAERDGVAEKEWDLEAANYKAKVELKLSQIGYSIVDNISDADFLAAFVYGIDNGREMKEISGSYGDVSTKTYTIYRRMIALLVSDPSFKNQFYNGVSRSEGVCGEMASVFKEMLDALFADFPGKNGTSRVRDIPLLSNKC